MQRTLQPELLDSLPPGHPDALHNRRDLRIINAIIGNHRWFARTLPRLLRPQETALELGAGEGDLGLRLIRRGLAVDGLDLWPRPEAWPAGRGWHRGDLRAFEGYGTYAAVLGNLIFHQFPPEELTVLGAKIRSDPHTRLVLAAEPARRRISQKLFRFIAPLLGANYVSLHDAHVSIAAGFIGRELPDLLGLDAAAWDVRCRVTVRGAYLMIAIRRGARI